MYSHDFIFAQINAFFCDIMLDIVLYGAIINV